MLNRKNLSVRALCKIIAVCALFATVYFVYYANNDISIDDILESASYSPNDVSRRKSMDYNVWIIFTKVSEKSPLRFKFRNLIANILNRTSVPLKFHILVDNVSRILAGNDISDVVSAVNKPILYKLYYMEDYIGSITGIVQAMTPFFSSKPGTYFSDALFYVSLGLYRIAPESQETAVLLDCDLYFKKDVRLLFEEFKKFKPSALFGLAPELTPVYRHMLRKYKSKKNTTFGEYYHENDVYGNNNRHPRGFQGYNSGVVLLKLSAIRESIEYADIIKRENVEKLASKYMFNGNLGDQDFYTLVGFEHPHLIQTLNCGFNRQLCILWRDHGYSDVFNHYSKCRHPTMILHGNCNTEIPNQLLKD